MARMVSLPDLMDRARQAADTEGDPHISDVELISKINAAVPELHDLLVAAYGEDYFFLTETANFSSNERSYALPSDFYKLLGVDVETNAASGVWLPIFRYGERRRTEGEGYPGVSTSEIEYRLRGPNIVFTPPPQSAARQYRLNYVPTAPVLIKTTFATTDVDTGSDWITLTDHRLYLDHPLRFAPSAGSSDALPGGLTANTTYYAKPVDQDTIQIAAAVGGAAIVLTDVGVGTHTTFSMFDGVNGWEELIVIDAAIDMQDKQETSTGGKERKRGRLLKRLEKMSDNRDAGEPETIQDVSMDPDQNAAFLRYPRPL